MFNVHHPSRVQLKDYMTLTREERRQHLNLDSPCVEMGGCSRSNRALLGMYLGTTCEGNRSKTGLLCHACGNDKCSNPEHLYWGSSSDNAVDRVRHNPQLNKVIAELNVARDPHHYKKIGSKGGQAYRNSKNKTALSVDTINDRLFKIAFSGINLSKFGWVKKVSELLGVSHRCTRQFVTNYYPGETYKRG
jgi:hypothetical protein